MDYINLNIDSAAMVGYNTVRLRGAMNDAINLAEGRCEVSKTGEINSITVPFLPEQYKVYETKAVPKNGAMPRKSVILVYTPRAKDPLKYIIRNSCYMTPLLYVSQFDIDYLIMTESDYCITALNLITGEITSTKEKTNDRCFHPTHFRWVPSSSSLLVCGGYPNDINTVYIRFDNVNLNDISNLKWSYLYCSPDLWESGDLNIITKRKFRLESRTKTAAELKQVQTIPQAIKLNVSMDDLSSTSLSPNEKLIYIYIKKPSLLQHDGTLYRTVSDMWREYQDSLELYNGEALPPNFDQQCSRWLSGKQGLTLTCSSMHINKYQFYAMLKKKMKLR